MKKQMYLLYVDLENESIGLSELKEDKIEPIFNDTLGEFTESGEKSVWTEWEDCSTISDAFKRIMKKHKE